MQLTQLRVVSVFAELSLQRIRDSSLLVVNLKVIIRIVSNNSVVKSIIIIVP